ncbi:RnfH family protein [Moraxella sp. Tifton1]|uniref:RnfH family protein n=1 Tax=Moraxella oculi TaxID=2940516 RepID=UPI0020123C24|nr:RnfH family protein [Moraxella sp. Tifton1]MCL1623150.1 RnfH family protein [Moraxella sp. Tifton1]
MIDIALSYVSLDKEQLYHEMTVPVGTTIHQALMMSGWLDLAVLQEFAAWCQHHAQADPNHKAWYVGIYSQKKRLDTILCAGDRIEIYRSLTHDPMSRRKQKSKSRQSK